MSFYDFLVYASLILWVLFGTGLVISLILIVPKILKGFRTIDELTDAITNRMLPILESIESAVQGVARVADTVTGSVERIDETIDFAADSVERMVEVAEDRVAELNAVVSVAVEEVEDTFLSTAGLVHSTAGVVRALRGGGDRREERRERRDDRRNDRRKERRRRKKRRKRKDRWLLGG